MNSIVKKTFGGLSPQYYFRQFIFGLIFPLFFYYMSTKGSVSGIPFQVTIFLIVSTLLYPYSRFVYDSIINFIMGDNVFFANVLFVLMVKIITMAICWSFAIFIAPIGLAYLYYHHSKVEA